MRKIKLFLGAIFLLLPCISHAEGFFYGVAAAGGGCTIADCSGAITCTGNTGCSKRETFQGSTSCYSGFDSTCDNSWSYAANNVDFSYATSPAPLQSTNSAYLPASATNKAFLSFTGASTIYAGAIITISSTPSQVTNILMLETELDTPVCKLQFYGASIMQVANSGGTTQTTSVSLSTDTPYYVMLKATAGTGSNASCTPYFSSNGTSWTTGAASTDGTWTADVVDLALQGFSGSPNIIYDDIRISTSSFNYW